METMPCSPWFVSYDKQDRLSDWIFTDWLFRWIKHNHVTKQMSQLAWGLPQPLWTSHQALCTNHACWTAAGLWHVAGELWYSNVLKFQDKVQYKIHFYKKKISILNKCIKWKFAFWVIQMPHTHAHTHARVHMHAHVHTRAHTHTHTHTRTIQHNRGKSIQIKRSKTPLPRLITCTVITPITTLHRLSIHSQNN